MNNDKSVQYEISGERQPLAKILPTHVPLSVNIAVTEQCNLRCEFCKHGNDEKKGRTYTAEDTMKLEIVEKLADDFKKYSYPKLKQAIIAGGGEPLIHKDIDGIVRTLSETVSDRVAIITNGTLLTRELSCRLLDAGLDVLRVSLNGLNGEDYKKHTGRFVDVDAMYENLKFFKEEAERRVSQGKKKCLVYVKIIDYMVADKEKKDEFFDRWKNASDIQSIETLYDSHADIDFQSLGAVNQTTGRYGQEFSAVPKICPRPFFDCYLQENGDAVICCHYTLWEEQKDDYVMGNIMDENLADIWNGRKFIQERKSLLSGKNMLKICRGCSCFRTAMTPEDVLDGDADRLFEVYDRMERKGEK
jgi:MoaA/NifB/PqqE/SkfB family radical SAM enzyme